MDPAKSNLPSLSAFETTGESPSHNKTSLIVPLSSIESFTKEYEEINRKYRQEAMELDYRIRMELMEREKQHREESMRCVFKFFRGSQRVDSSTASSIIQSSPSVSNAIAPPSAPNATHIEENKRPLSEIPANRSILGEGRHGYISQHNSGYMVYELHCDEYMPDGNELCKATFINFDQLSEHHYKVHGIKMFPCLSLECSRGKVSFSTNEELNQHYTTVHELKIKCKGAHCLNTYKSTRGISRHYERTHQRGLYQCIHCEKCFNYIPAPNAHKHAASNGQTSAGNNFIGPIRNMRYH